MAFQPPEPWLYPSPQFPQYYLPSPLPPPPPTFNYPPPPQPLSPPANSSFLRSPFSVASLSTAYNMPKAEHNIDLQCLLCTKNPKFSDVSHLLTHISSKSHLAARFKLEIQAQSNGGARSNLDDFNFWYRASNIDALLADRMAAKEHKKTKKNRQLTEASNVHIKAETDQQSVPESIRATPFAETPVQGFRAPVPRMHLWSTAANTTTYSEWERSPPTHVYETPTARRQVPNFGRPETPPAAKLDPELATPWKADLEDEEKGTCSKFGEKLTDSAKLKGVIYPGMDLFDSATPEMKRKRNQKKDGAILGQMLATSRGTEPAEISYHPNGDFRASRDIFGPLSTENSPEIPSPKKRRSRKPTTTTLFNIPVNAPRQRAPRGKKAAAGSPRKQRHHPMLAPPPVFFQPAPSLNSMNAGFGRRFVPTTEEDEEFRLTVEDMGKKRNFNIFQDATQASPARTETPLDDDRFDLHGATRGLTSYSSEAQTSSRFPVSPTPVPKSASYRPYGKENGMPELPAQQNARRAPSAPVSLSHGYPPQMFLNHSSLNPLYNPMGYARSFGGFANPSYHMTNVPMGFGTTFHGDFKPSGPMLQHQPSQGEDMGKKNDDFENSMNFNL